MYFTDGGPRNFFGSETLAKSDFLGSMKDARIFWGCKKKHRDFFGCVEFDIFVFFLSLFTYFL